MVSALAREEGAAACVAVSKNVGDDQGSAVGRPAGRLRHMHRGVAEFLLSAGARRRRRKEAAPATEREGEEEWGEPARYECAFQDEGLVWAKVKGHPWWPGQVFDMADASELARRERRRRGASLVACFWDKTFAWVGDAAELCPFRAGFPRLARNGMAASAVDAALAEVARRVDAGLSCGCVAAKKQQQQVIGNAGLREGARGAAVDAAFARDAFRGEAFVEYISTMAMAPLAGADRLDLTVATAQLRAFTWWRGTRCLPGYTASYGIEDIVNGAMPACRDTGKRRRSRGGDDADADADAGKRMSRCSRARGNTACENVDDAVELENFEPNPQPLSHQMSTKMGKLMSRAAHQMSRSPVICRADRNTPQAMSGVMIRCRKVADHTTTAPSVNLQNGGLKDELVLNFTGPSAVPSTSDLVKIFSQFGPIKEARTENSVAVVIFTRSMDAKMAFSGTVKIGALSANLISFRLTYSLPAAAPVDPPQSTLNTDEKDHLPVEAV